ncbi:MAG TPA: LysM peptidoglycan-binding domain-containing protein [Deltaproteobacteria bacterium]|nr:LysM peptidoglycan-binding domain-containing protein [Deltaproteobacteria bacterium]
MKLFYDGGLKVSVRSTQICQSSIWGINLTRQSGPLSLFFILSSLLSTMAFLALPCSAGEQGIRPQPQQKPVAEHEHKHVVPFFPLPEEIELCGEPVPLQYRDVRERLEREFIISVYNHAQVYLWLKRKSRYFPHIDKRLKEEGLPDDLKYLAVAESDLMDYAYSPKGAAGHWQFIRSTGRRCGLSINKRRDERLNFFKATDAAFTYLKELHDEFGSWTLAMAAYNCGEIRVRKEIAEQRVHDYYRMNLPRETERYIFRIIAIKLILSDPEKYGYYLPEGEEYPEINAEQVWIRSKVPVHMRIIAEACNTCFKEIKELNPDYRGYYIPAGLHEIYVPKGCAGTFPEVFSRYSDQVQKEAKRAYPAKRRARKKKKHSKYKVYVVKKGDTLATIAKTFGVPISKIKKWNNLSKNIIVPGQSIKIYE